MSKNEVSLWLHYLKRSNLGMELGKSKGRKTRPALSIGKYNKTDNEIIVFLTTRKRENRPKVSINKECNILRYLNYNWQPEAYLYEEGKNKRYILLPKSILEMMKSFKLCGHCKLKNRKEILEWVLEYG